VKAIQYILFSLLLGLWAYYRTDGFHPWKLSPTESSTPTDGSSLTAFFTQPYRYLDRGRQSFVFESADRRYVIKFFDRTYSELPFWLSLLPKERKEKEISKRQYRAQLYRTGYEIAFEELRQESGLIALHFEPTEQLPPLRIQTKAGRELQIDLNRTDFVLQKKAAPFTERLAATKEAYNALLNLRISRGIGDYEHHIDRNFGWLGEQLILLDPGRLHHDPNLTTYGRATQERELFTARFEKWRKKQ
jgi:hypothetical protein